MEYSFPIYSPSTTPSPNRPEPIIFTGSGKEYFGIWIVNLFLTIITLGIYSAWAKVRRLQYFYRHTELADSGFDFHGNPLRILIGRVIAVAMLAAYNFSVRLHSYWTIVAFVAIAVVLPLLLRNSLRFRLYNSSWRGTRFHFRGSLAGAYRVFLLNPLLTLVTLYGLAPFAHQRLKAYQHNNSWFGQTRFSFHAGVGKFYLAYSIVVAAVIAVGLLFFLSGAFTTLPALLVQKPGKPFDMQAIFKLILVAWGSLLLFSLFVGTFFHAFITNLVWNNTCLGEHRIQCDMPPLHLLWISVSNLLMTVVTLGLFYPWALVRMARFQIGCITLFPASDLQDFIDSDADDVGAIGEEAATIFDIDISL